MKAMIFAAGVGKRLQPVSLHTPKALVQLGPKTMLELVAEKLIRFGATSIVVNIHHHPKKMKDFMAGLKYPGVDFYISDETDLLLNTGGGLLKARDFLEGAEPVILHNVDVLSNIDLGAMVKSHLETGALATLAVTNRKTSRYFLFDEQRLAGWENTQTGQQIFCRQQAGKNYERMAFSGIHVIDPKLPGMIIEKGAFSINEVYLRLAKEHEILSFEHNHHYWADIGTPEKLESARKLFNENIGIF